MEVRRGDFVAAVAPGEYGKPRPALVIQSDLFRASASVAVLLLTSDLCEEPNLLRKRVMPTLENGLRVPSDIMIDKIVALSRGKMRQRFGALDKASMSDVTEAIAVLLGF